MNDDGSEPHSALYLNDDRDTWWNTDYLRLLGARLGFSKEGAVINNVLDVGCGKGHWTRLVARMVPPSARIVGVDMEQQWVDEATAATNATDGRITFVKGDANALPFADAFFDVVTCQTVLIHVKDVAQTLAEMLRVLRPGGRIVACEPNNLGETFAHLIGDPAFDLDDVLAAAKLDAVCQKGKHALGSGYNSRGEGLAHAFEAAGVRDIQAWNNDKCHLAILPTERASFDAGNVLWPIEESRRYYDAGLKAAGVNAQAVEDFATLWARARRAMSKRFDARAVRNEGGLFYVVAGVKP